MFDWGYCEFNMWQTYSNRLREAEKDRLVRQARPGQKRRFRFPSWARVWLERHPSALQRKVVGPASQWG